MLAAPRAGRQRLISLCTNGPGVRARTFQSTPGAVAKEVSRTYIFDPEAHYRAIPITSYTTVEDDDDDAQSRVELSDERYERIRALLTPLVLLAPQPSDLVEGYKPRDRGVEAKVARVSPAVALHSALEKDEGTVCLYTDGSVKRNGQSGAAATMPSLDRTTIRYLGVQTQPRRSMVAEFAALSLGLELAAEYSPAGAHVAAFTDAMFERHFSAAEWRDEAVTKACIRAERAIGRLREKHTGFRLYWVPGHRNMVKGIILADRAATEASRPRAEVMQRLKMVPRSAAGLAFDDVGLLPSPVNGYCIPGLMRPSSTFLSHARGGWRGPIAEDLMGQCRAHGTMTAGLQTGKGHTPAT